MADHYALPNPPPSIIPRRVLDPSRREFDLGWPDDDSDFEERPQRSAEALVPYHSSARQTGSQGDPSFGIIPIGSHTSGITWTNDTSSTGNGQQHLPLYYSTKRSNRQRNTQRRSESRHGTSGSYSRTFNSDTGMTANFEFQFFVFFSGELNKEVSSQQTLTRSNQHGTRRFTRC